jgi:hypothetical protein
MRTARFPSPTLDTDGRPINAHGGGFLHHAGLTYWYGECRPPGPSSQNATIGFSCYSSPDLVAWKNEGVVLGVVRDDDSHPLASGCKMERPKVAHCARTGKFVLWWHHDLKGWGHAGALAGVAVADSPTGPFTFLRAFKPNWWMFRDCTLFVDDDASAWLVYASDDNANLVIHRLSDDYLEPTAVAHRVFIGRYMEAPCVFKHEGNYYLVASDCTGWHPNEARSAVAPTLAGPWRELGNPCLGPGAEITFGAQSTYVLPVPGRAGEFIFMADRWVPERMEASDYLWLPITFRRTVPFFPPRPFITLETTSGIAPI